MSEFRIGDLVWATMKGFSPWPGRVSVPITELKSTRPVNSHCIYFFGLNNYAWIHKTSIKSYLIHKSKMVKSNHAVGLQDAVDQAEQYILDPEKFSHINNSEKHRQNGEVVENGYHENGVENSSDSNSENNSVEDKNEDLMKSASNLKKYQVPLYLNPYVKLERMNLSKENDKMKIKNFIYYSHREILRDMKNLQNMSELFKKHITSTKVALEQINLFKCKECCSFFTHEKEYMLHRLTHVQPVDKRRKPREHIQKDAGLYVKRYKCDECEAAFVEESTLAAHAEVHLPFPHVCFCGIGYYRKKDLDSHKQLVHPHETKPVWKPKIKYTGPKETPEFVVKIEPGLHKKPTVKPKLKAKLKTKKSNKSANKFSEEENKILDACKNGDRFECPHCNRSYVNKHYLQAHILTHTGDPPYKCEECGKAFLFHSSLNSHMKSHTNTRDYVCPACKKRFNCKSHLNIHLRVHTGERPYACHLCPKKYTQSNQLKLHVKRHNNILDYTCGYCDKLFISQGALDRHLPIHTGERAYECRFCQKSFNDPSALARHHRTHTGYKPYQCKMCPMKFSDASGLRMHAKRHAGIKEFLCELCDKTFYCNSSLVKHLISHAQLKMYECDICGNKFTQKANLSLHIHTTHATVKKYQCLMCGKKFAGKNYLTIHLQRHNTDKRFECDHCGKTFAIKTALRAHIIINHLDIYFCNICLRRFYSFNDYRNHKIENCVKREFLCEICNKSFKSGKLLQCHLRVHNKVVKSENLKYLKRSEKPKVFECDYCTKKFPTRSQITSHLKKTHLRVKKKMKCDDCGKKFLERRSMVGHWHRNHSSIALYCDRCKKLFISEKRFRQHKAKGCPVVEYQKCSICGQNVRNLDKHMLVHTVGKIYNCKFCKKAFKKHKFLARHVEEFHDADVKYKLEKQGIGAAKEL